ncbi:metallophosphoesterase family protein [Halochromatium glycolicum]|uniref:Metallophosphoesterase n=1 Tax=Halochromatium glycolicum TaxID=85075 RepID=A0AAJ0U7U1_9GAMM|nr:metallophosphoesterase family protein [Halochromatium glycolicum]MBK1706913.1 metallophosphoesterase [Halochromatium glycolicum]
MKVAVFSDIQANLPALEETIEQIERWRPDLVVMAGDLVNRGPDSGGCLRRFDEMRRDRGWLPVNGNHEEWVLASEHRSVETPGERALWGFTQWAWSQCAADAERLRGWADHLTFHPPESDAWVHVTHGTMAGNRDGITPGRSDESLVGALPEDIALFIAGHTHRPHQRRTQCMLVVNVGSAGSPFDGDPRGSFGRFVWQHGRWQAEIRRFDYDRDQARRDFLNSGFLDQSPLARIVYHEWERAELLIAGWRERYQQAVLAGELDAERSVRDYLQGLGLE